MLCNPDGSALGAVGLFDGCADGVDVGCLVGVWTLAVGDPANWCCLINSS